MNILIINGPNLNLLGKREPDIYGHETWESVEKKLQEKARALGLEIKIFQSNIEGELINEIQRAEGNFSGIILNAAGYTHTSVAIRDALKATNVKAIEVHLTNPAAREEFRAKSLLAGAVCGTIAGFGGESYLLALDWFSRNK